MLSFPIPDDNHTSNIFCSYISKERPWNLFIKLFTLIAYWSNLLPHEVALPPGYSGGVSDLTSPVPCFSYFPNRVFGKPCLQKENPFLADVESHCLSFSFLVKKRCSQSCVMLLPNFTEGPVEIFMVSIWCRIALELQHVETRPWLG